MSHSTFRVVVWSTGGIGTLAVRAIAENPDAAYDYTAKGNLVAVISNGTAILGLGDLGALLDCYKVR